MPNRATDDGNTAVYARQRRSERARTIFIAVVCSGAVSLGIVHINEVRSTNEKNSSCRLVLRLSQATNGSRICDSVFPRKKYIGFIE
jgi:hypothetical protein